MNDWGCFVRVCVVNIVGLVVIGFWNCVVVGCDDWGVLVDGFDDGEVEFFVVWEIYCGYGVV